MAKIRSRATTRWNLTRAKNKALVVAKGAHFKGAVESRDETAQAVRELAVDFYRNRQACSCASCGNARRSGWAKGNARLTVQELRVLVADID